jgi:hypothetical protein
VDRAAAITSAIAAAALAGAIAAVAGSCSDGQTSTTRDTGVDPQISMPYDGGAYVTPDATDDTPYYNDDGWVGLQGFDRTCGIYSAPSLSAKNFPPPIAWEPCDARVRTPDGGALICQQMADNWGSGVAAGDSPVGFFSSSYVDRPSQKVFLPLLRKWGSRNLNIVAEVDGPIHQAVVSQTPLCDLGTFSSIGAMDVAYHVEEFSSAAHTQTILAGALGGPFDALPRMLRSYPNLPGVGYVAGANEFAEYGAAGFDTGSWVDGHRIDTITTSAPGQLAELTFQGDNLFFSMDDLNYGRVQMFAHGTGVIDFISFGATTDSYAADLGTDGADMVWTEAFGHPGGNTNPWTTINIMTAPYTTDPTAIVKRRLRSEVRNLGDVPFTVGCGYAAHEISTLQGTGVRIVRISDGVSWSLFNLTSPLLTWNAAVAITCSEIFVNFNFGSTSTNLARIRLDSLGPGDPAD